MVNEQRKLNKPLAKQVAVSLACYLSTMTTTICYYSLAPLIIVFTEELKLMTTAQFAIMTAVPSVAETICCIPISWLADRYGRKKIILSVGPISAVLLGALIMTKNLYVLFFIRLGQGVMLGIVEVVASVYIAEISNAKWRGTLGSYYSVFCNLGTLYVYINAGYLEVDYYLASLIAIPVLCTLTFVFAPESPYYYFMVSKRDKAVKSLSWLRCKNNVDDEAKMIENAVNEDMRREVNWKSLVATRADRRALFIVLIVTVSRYMIGVGTFMAYSNSIFSKTQNQLFTSNQLSIITAILFAVTALAISFFSDTVGRKKLLLISLSGTLISNLVLCVYFFLVEKTLVNMLSQTWILYTGAVGFCIFANVGLTQLLPTVKAEYFPSHTRSKGSALSTIVSGIVVFIQMYTFPLIDQYCGIYVNFIIFSIFSALGIILVLTYFTEAARKTLAEVNTEIKKVAYKENTTPIKSVMPKIFHLSSDRQTSSNQ